MSGWLWPEPPPPPPPPSPIEAWGPDIIWATGWLGFCGSLILTQLSTAKTLGFAQAINNVLFVIHFLFLGAWGGVASQVVGVANGVLKYHHENATCRKLHSFLPLALIPLTAYTYEKPLDLLPSLAVGGRLLAFRAQSMMHTRLGCTLALTPWVPYSLAVNSRSSLINVVFAIALQLITIVRLDLLGSSKDADGMAKGEAKQKKG
mmetsp:Transcript_35823/g.94095  ORF Transcript_35823/g.94095 Transcript_35823/m.94095 type:complete len:205 (-) Transcript_35823:196-810(-)|eukprot:CAMPEP_0115846404 /NCGR_PEP_ID=MMETSP0287-20121206/9844_1 /TAXON_ID=412157 /ORGANISM="Chrysochromulina rotalis, Strain UIO044" /LENGTH=204 /DNA_ID=CAMNT_0003300195 /DNA_START=40 /DNA_END=654 /DNA_ORIENTATION=+